MSYNRYPLAMHHPGYKPAVLSQDKIDPVTHQIIKAAPGQPAKFPPVYVNNPDQEAQYAAEGYIPNGEPDPDAYYRAQVGATEPNDHKFREFPKWLYKPVGPGEYEAKLLNDQAAQDNLPEGEAWYATPGDAVEASYADDEEEVEGKDTGEAEGAPETRSQGGKRGRR